MPISIDRYLYLSPQELEFIKGDKLHGLHGTPPALDYRLLQELENGTLPEGMHSYMMKRVFDLGNAGAKQAISQKKKAQKPRAGLVNIIPKLAKRPGTAKELWGALFAELESEGLHPRQIPAPIDGNWKSTAYSYEIENGGVRKITLGTFENRLSAARKSR